MFRPSLRPWAIAPLALIACGKGSPDAAQTSAPPAATSAAAAPTPPPKAPAPAPSAPSTAGASAGCGWEGTYEAVGYACQGEKQQAFPSFLRWTFTMNGADASFTEATSAPIPQCRNTQPFKAACGGSPAQLTLTPPGPGTCDPPNCARSGKPGEPGPCVKTPHPLLWSVAEHTPTTLTLTSVEPFHLTTCTSRHKNNPLTVWWRKK